MGETGLGTRLLKLAVAGLVWAEILLVAGVLVHVLVGWNTAIRVEHGRLPPTVPTIARTHLDRRLSFSASIVANLGVDVRCWSSMDWERRWSSSKRWSPTVGKLSPWQSYGVGEPVEIELGPAALAFQAVQVTGRRNHAEVGCYALQSIPLTAIKLGATPKEAGYLATLFRKHWYPWTPPAFRSSECKNGGRLDLHPRTDVWP